ncbi:GNAT family N-acetyltransferase [Sphingomonas sp. 8AM]|uniref:GNAT family N-acetyltransferase n=1 Tax=Sphingomonas sp. 8AM TaxID=2653170 RepID=UPI0012EFAD7F|nr:N-acetyltransferase [Sphingomonas sp. 8AM]VXC98709.1 GCN5 family acetyltransferase [Sphingomonas sp. 8AM]
MTQMVPIDSIAGEAVEQLLDRAFGRDRHARTAYRLRAGTHAIAALSFALVDGESLLGSIQCWPVQFDGDDGSVRPLVLVGPVAIVPERQQEGLGRRLMEAALAAAAGGPPLVLIGDPEYYGRFFGFDAAATAQWRLPGPVERHRLLARGANLPALPGVLGPRRHASAAA